MEKHYRHKEAREVLGGLPQSTYFHLLKKYGVKTTKLSDRVTVVAESELKKLLKTEVVEG